MEITKQLAHVMSDENLFVREVARTEIPNQFVSRFIVDGRHPYLYENAAIANHVSGTTFLDACRQLLKAISHLYYEAPLDNRFVIRTCDMDFGRWAKINVPIEIVAEISAQTSQLRGHNCTNFTATVNYYQEGRLTGTMTGKYSTFPAAVEDLLMSRQYRQAPVETAPIQRAV